MRLHQVMLVAVIILFSGCTSYNREIDAYQAFAKKTSPSNRRNAFHALSLDEKTAVYLGANAIHPPITQVTSLIQEEPISVLTHIRGVLQARENYVEIFDFVIEARAAKQRGLISPADYESLEVSNLCDHAKTEEKACRDLLSP